MNPDERRILLVTSLGHFLSHYNMLVFPSLVLPLTLTTGLDMPTVLGLSFWMYLLFGVSALPWGMLGDRIGGKWLLMAMFVGSGIGGIAACIWIGEPIPLMIALSGIGLFSGVYHPIGLGLISKGIERISIAMGYNAVFGGLGLVVAPLLTGLVNWLSGPRAAYGLLAGINLFGALLMLLIPPAEPHAEGESTASRDKNGNLRAFLILLVAMMLGGIAYRGATVILPAYLELRNTGLLESLIGLFGMDLSANLVATTVTAMIYTVGMVGQYIGGHVGDRYEHRYSYLVFHAICIPAAFLMAFTSNVALIGLAFVYFFFLLGMQPVENTLVATFTPRRLHHSAFGMKFILTFGVGALAVKILQYVENVWGIEASFLVLGSVSVLIVATIIVLISQTTAEGVKAHQPEEPAAAARAGQ